MGYCILPTPYIGACLDLPAFSGGSISYDFRIFTEINGRPYGTVATYECDNETLLGEATRTCENGVWSGSVPNCGSKSVFCKSIFLSLNSDQSHVYVCLICTISITV